MGSKQIQMGDPNHEATHAQASAICVALDKLMKKRGLES